MPIPSPRSGEKQDAFISRCMSAMKSEFPDQKQRAAVCFNAFRKKGENMSKNIHVEYARPISTIVEKVGEGKETNLYITGNAIDVGTSRNGVYYSEKELMASAKTLIDKPLLLNHGDNDVRNIIGKVVEADFDGHNVPFKAILARPVDIEDEKIISKIKQGFINKVSIGADFKTATEDDDGIIHPEGIEFLELSLVPIAGVPNASISQVIAENYRGKKMEEKKTIEQLKEELKAMTEEKETLEKKLDEKDAEDPPAKQDGETDKPDETDPSTDPPADPPKDETGEKVESLEQSVKELTKALFKTVEKPKGVASSKETSKFEPKLEITGMTGITKAGMKEIWTKDCTVENHDPSIARKYVLY